MNNKPFGEPDFKALFTDALRERTSQMDADLYQLSREAEEASIRLKQANAGQAHLLDLAHILICDLNDCIVSWNTGAETLYGFSKEEAMGKVSHDLLNTVFPVSKEAVTEALKTTGDWQGELVHKAKDGHRVVVASHQVIQLDDDGTPFAIIEVNNDITDLKNAEEALRDSEERFRALATASSDVVYRMAPDWTEMHHLRGRDFIADTETPSRDWLLKYIPVEDQPHVMEVIDEAIRTRSVFELEHRVLRVDGSVGWTFSRAIPILDTNGEIVEWFGAASDITKRKQAEQALRESEERFRTLADAIPQLAWMADPDGYIFWYNSRWYEYTGTTPEQMKGWGWQSVHLPEALPKVLERWRNSIETGKPFDMEFPLLGADAKFRMFLTRVMPIKDSEGHILRWFGTNTDVSEARELESHKQEFYRRTIQAATEGKLIISDSDEIHRLAGPVIGTWQIETIDEFARATREAVDIARRQGIDEMRAYEFQGCVTEAATNVLKHAKGGHMSLHRLTGGLMVIISDTGPGIAAMAIPSIALTRNYSTAGTLGMGYKLMLHFADHLYLATGPEGTTVAVEMKLHKAVMIPTITSTSTLTAWNS